MGVNISWWWVVCCKADDEWCVAKSSLCSLLLVVVDAMIQHCWAQAAAVFCNSDHSSHHHICTAAVIAVLMSNIIAVTNMCDAWATDSIHQYCGFNKIWPPMATLWPPYGPIWPPPNWTGWVAYQVKSVWVPHGDSHHEGFKKCQGLHHQNIADQFRLSDSAVLPSP